MQKNFSLTEFNYQHNYFDTEFTEAVKTELELNESIVKNILPQLYE